MDKYRERSERLDMLAVRYLNDDITGEEYSNKLTELDKEV